MSEETENEETVDETAAEEAPVEATPETPEPEAPAEAAAPAPAAAAEPAEPAEVLSPKETAAVAVAPTAARPLPSAPVSSVPPSGSRPARPRPSLAPATARQQKAKKGEAGTGTPAAEPVEGIKKVRQGIVTSAKADKTITVAVQSARRHPSYEKIVRRSKSLHAHDERNEAGEGDTVRIIESRPMSKTKRWRLVEVVEKAK